MPKIVLNNLQNLDNKVSAVSTINQNNQTTEEAVENTLSRDGSGPNEMEASIDMNGNPIYNLPKATSGTEPVRKAEFDQLDIAADVGALTDAVADAEAAAATATTQAGIATVKAQEAVDAAASIVLPPVVANTMLVANPAGTVRENKTFTEVKTLLNIVDSSSIFYNAVSDGGCDNTGATVTASAVQSAITSAKAAGKTCYFPEGVYDLGGTGVTISSNDVKILCQSRLTEFRKTVDNSTPAFTFTGSNVSFQGGQVKYTLSTFAVANGHSGIFVTGANPELVDVYVRGRFYIGIDLQNTANAKVIGCTVKGVVNRCYYLGIPATVGNGRVYFHDCHADCAEADGSATPYTNYGFNTNGFGTGTLSHVMFSDCTAYYFTFHGFGISERIFHQQLDNCTALGGSGPGFLIQKANTFNQQRTQLSNCKSISNQIGFQINEAFYVSMTNCVASINTSIGILVQGSWYVTLTGCRADNNTSYGIYSDTNCNTCNFVGNLSTQNSGGNYSISGTSIGSTGNA